MNKQGKKTVVKLAGKNVGIITLGCARNTVDSEKILIDAKREGALICPPEKADIVLVNTCAFTQEAKQESLAVIRDLVVLKKKGKIEDVLVYGCLSERYKGELSAAFQEVGGFYGIADFKNTLDPRIRLTPAHAAYVKISEGCANQCSYCAIPAIKGPLHSRRVSSIIDEVKLLERTGIRELDIVGQDITLFGKERSLNKKGPLPLVGLLKKILAVTSIPWIRLLYLHPDRIGDDLLELVSTEERICPYLDLPLQHINDRILKLMDRKTTKKEILALIEKIRHRVPSVALRTSFIVGFPSETKKEFQELLDFLKEVRFEKMGAFMYSREEKTRAYSFKGQFSRKIKEERYNSIMSLARDISLENQKRYINKVLDVMVDEKTSETGIFLGRSRFDAPEVDGVVFLKSSKKLEPGQIVKASITDATEYDLSAEVVI